MPTPRGWLTVAGAVGFVLAGRILGIVELDIVAAAMAALAVAAFVHVRVTPFRLGAHRELRPTRVYAGSPSRVELAVRNLGPRPSPVLAARDPFDRGRRSARFLIAPLGPQERARAAYRLPTERRGVFDLGPLELRLADPFGLASASLVAAPATKLTVYPHIDHIEPLPHTVGLDPHAGSHRATNLSQRGEEFFALRPYEVGDDLRRVHWPSTARTGELMIRQDELPWQGRVTVLLDLRPAVHNSASVELAVSAAASIVAASWGRRSLLRLVGTDGVDSGFAAGQPHVEAILEHLAAARPRRVTGLTGVLASLRRQGGGGGLAVVTTAGAASHDLDAIARLRGRYGAVVLVLFERSSYDPAVAALHPQPRALPALSRVVRVSADRPFALAWSDMVRGLTRSSPGPRLAPTALLFGDSE
ncbi:MAG TPA: DUF58 domain-containing protein [Acidimicrobiales bacterium]|nr:DUF58 domain-containing protein [Acidimicrobiales bacterium]